MTRLRIVSLVGLCTVVVGCAKSPYSSSVSGKITYKGQPVKAGMVYFIFDVGGQYESPLKTDGSYEFIDIPTGQVKVLVDNAAFDPDQKSPVYGAQSKAMASGYSQSYDQYNKTVGGGEGAHKKEGGDLAGLSKDAKAELAKLFVKIPKRYANAKTTSLTYTVEKGSQTKDFDLSD